MGHIVTVITVRYPSGSGAIAAHRYLMRQKSNKAAEYPKESRGSKIADENRKQANSLTDAERESLFKRGMQIIYGAAGKAKAACSR